MSGEHALLALRTGLDARAAAIVMQAVRNVARNGRTVMVTIHQVSEGATRGCSMLWLLFCQPRLSCSLFTCFACPSSISSISQPSIEIFEAFDMLLLIQKGGRTTYFVSTEVVICVAGALCNCVSHLFISH